MNTIKSEVAWGIMMDIEAIASGRLMRGEERQLEQHEVYAINAILARMEVEAKALNAILQLGRERWKEATYGK